MKRLFSLLLLLLLAALALPARAMDIRACSDPVVFRGAAVNALVLPWRADEARSASVGAEPLELTRREWTLIEILAARPGRIFAKGELLERVFAFEEESSENAVEQIVARLRRKLTAAGARAEIRTLRGLGYQVVCPDP